MNTIVLLHASGLCGGIKVVCELVSRLAARGFPIEVWATAPRPMWFGVRRLPWRGFNSLARMGDELRATRAYKIATWWETAYWVQETLKNGDKGFYLVQTNESIDYAQNEAHAARIRQTYNLGLTPITLGNVVTTWMRDEMKLDPQQIGIAIDHDVYYPQDIKKDPNRVFVPYRPFDGPDDLKGWRLAQESISLARATNPNLSVVSFGKSDSPAYSIRVPNIHIKNTTDVHLRELYSQCGCFLFPSKREGFGLPALEAMACGAPVVATKAWGNEEFCVEGVTAWVSNDANNLAIGIAKMTMNREYAGMIAGAGRAMALTYQWDNVIDKFQKVLT